MNEFEAIAAGILFAFAYCGLLRQPLFPPNPLRFSVIMYESLMTINIHYLLSWLFSMHIIAFSEETVSWTMFPLYFVLFEMVYMPWHMFQHEIPWLRRHHAAHHQIQLCPGYAFAGDPLDAVVEHTLAQSVAAILQPDKDMYWYLMCAMAFIRVMAHSHRGWSRSFRWHHRMPYRGRFSFSGFPDDVIYLLQ